MSRDQRGTISPLILGFALFVIFLIAVVVDASAVFVRRQSLASLADGAALYGADAGARAAVYSGIEGQLTQSRDAASAGVREYLRLHRAGMDFPGLRVSIRVVDGGHRLRVTVSAPLELPLHFPGAPLTTTVTAEAAAVVQVRP